MPILDKPVSWRRPRKERAPTSDLTPEEHVYIRAALAVLRVRLGGWEKLAKAMGVTEARLRWSSAKAGRPTAGLALRASRVAGAPLEELLSGAWPKPGACPMCGRVTEAP